MQETIKPIFSTLTDMLNGEDRNDTHPYPSDYQHCRAFLLSYRGSEATFNSYRRELERLLQWSWFVKKLSISKLQREDIEAYLSFCQNPPKSWIGTKNVARSNPDWRPFVVAVTKTEFKNGVAPKIANYQLSERAMRELLAINNSFFNFLLQENAINTNPFAQLRQKSKYIRKQAQSQPIRRLTDLQWSYVLETAETMDERTLFIMSALYGMYLRISELAASERWIPKMRDFYQDIDGNWWFTTVGKGNKQRIISVSDQMLAALKRYRQSLGLTPLPTASDTKPLILKTKGLGAITSTRQIRSIVQKCFNQAISKMQDEGLSSDAQSLEQATVHWLRHTGISDDVKTRPREHVRDDAGHSSSAITDKYIDIELRARHASAKNKKLKDF